MTDAPVLTQIEGAVMRITLNRPTVLNAMDGECYRLFGLALQRAMRPDVRAVVVTGAGRAFCAGHDLSTMEDDDPASDLRWTDATVRGLAALEKPVIAAINGVAVGGGLSIALACDFRLCAATARLIAGFADAGLVPDFGASWLIARSIGADRAFRWIAEGGALTAPEALALGLVTSVIEPGDLLPEAEALAARMSQRPTRALGLAKTLLHAAPASSLADALEREAQAQTLAAATHDYQEALLAFREKRKPSFKGY
jgi:2-(1,2-epoxy-1,2-dihydrophenyl)acetyl-CoA isomerase